MICIAGKNQCALDALKHLISIPTIETTDICICLNKDDNGIDTWQPSLSKFALQNNIKINDRLVPRRFVFHIRLIYLYTNCKSHSCLFQNFLCLKMM